MPITDLADSFAFCRTLTRGAKSNFALAFRLLPPDERRAMDALYAFMRVTDDLSDEAGDEAEKRVKLAEWRARLKIALEVGEPPASAGGVWLGRCERLPPLTQGARLLPALRHVVHTYRVPPEHLFAVIDGVEADLAPIHFETFRELYPYCYRVASAVGLACIPIWGTTDSAARPFAEAAGIAFQLTNILRDLGEDRQRGRIYLPRDELARFHCPPEDWGRDAVAFRRMIRFQVARAAEYYRKSEPLESLLTPHGRAVFRVMARTYRALLDEVARHPTAVLMRRLRVNHGRKVWILATEWFHSTTCFSRYAGRHSSSSARNPILPPEVPESAQSNDLAGWTRPGM